MAARSRPTPQGWIARRIALGVLANYTVPLTAVITGPLLARTLGPEGRGEVAGIMTPATLVTTIGMLGVPYAATYLAASRSTSPTRILLAALPTILGASFVTVSCLVLLAPLLLSAHPEDVGFFRAVSLLVPLGFVATTMAAIAWGKRHYGLSYVTSASGAVLRMLALGALAVGGALTVRTAVWASFLPGLVGLVVFAPVFRKAKSEVRGGGDDGSHLSRTLASYGLRSWGITVAGLANFRLDQALMLPLAGADQLGYYAVAVSLAELTTPLTGAISAVLFREASAQPGWARVAQTARATVLLVGVLSAAGALLSPFAVPLVFGGDFSHAVPMAQILFAASVPLALRTVLGSGLLGAGRPTAASASEIVALAVTAPGLALLVSQFGGVGAACTSLLAYSTGTAFSVWQTKTASGMRSRDFLLPGREDARWIGTQIHFVLAARRARPRVSETRTSP